MKRNNSDRRVATVARWLAGAAALVVGLIVIRSLPDLVRYAKLERM